LVIDKTVGNVQLMQRINRLKVLNFVRAKGQSSRPEIVRITGLSPSSVTNIVGFLLEKKLLMESGAVDTREVGRKATVIQFNPAALQIVCVNIEAKKIDLALTDLAGNALKTKELVLDPRKSEKESLERIKAEIMAIRSEYEADPVDLAGIGIALSGLVLNHNQLVLSSSMHWRGVALKEYFEQAFNLPVFVQNNSRTKALWRLRQSKEEPEQNIIFLDLAMGVGIINFYDQRVNDAVIGEIGHTTVKKDGPLCFCGNHGCLEMMCSVDAIINQCSELLLQNRCPVLKRMMSQASADTPDYEMILQAFHQGDPDIPAVLRECGEYLGIALANIISLFNPQQILINGDQLLTEDTIYQTALAEADTRVNELFSKSVRYEKVCIDTAEEIRGLALYVSDQLFELSGFTL